MSTYEPRASVMKKVTFTAATAPSVEPFEITGYEVHPGLVVHRAPLGDARWFISHSVSGYLLTTALGCQTRKAVVAIADRLAPETDWTQSEDELVALMSADDAWRQRVKDIAKGAIR